jgi:hypothetical protein
MTGRSEPADNVLIEITPNLAEHESSDDVLYHSKAFFAPNPRRIAKNGILISTPLTASARPHDPICIT